MFGPADTLHPITLPPSAEWVHFGPSRPSALTIENPEDPAARARVISSAMVDVLEHPTPTRLMNGPAVFSRVDLHSLHLNGMPSRLNPFWRLFREAVEQNSKVVSLWRNLSGATQNKFLEKLVIISNFKMPQLPKLDLKLAPPPEKTPPARVADMTEQMTRAREMRDKELEDAASSTRTAWIEGAIAVALAIATIAAAIFLPFTAFVICAIVIGALASATFCALAVLDHCVSRKTVYDAEQAYLKHQQEMAQLN